MFNHPTLGLPISFKKSSSTLFRQNSKLFHPLSTWLEPITSPFINLGHFLYYSFCKCAYIKRRDSKIFVRKKRWVIIWNAYIVIAIYSKIYKGISRWLSSFLECNINNVVDVCSMRVLHTNGRAYEHIDKVSLEKLKRNRLLSSSWNINIPNDLSTHSNKTTHFPKYH